MLFVEVVADCVSGGPTHAGDRIAETSILLPGGIPQRLYANEPLSHWLSNRRAARHLEQLITGIPAASRLLFNFMHFFPEIMGIRGIDSRIYVCVDEFPRMWKRRTRGNSLRVLY